MFQEQNSYLPDFPQDPNAASCTVSVSCRILSQVDLSAETRAATQTLRTQHEYLHTHTHRRRVSALRARQRSARSAPLSARNVIPHLYSCLIFFYSPLRPHCDSNGRAYLKLTPASSERTRLILRRCHNGFSDVENIQSRREC